MSEAVMLIVLQFDREFQRDAICFFLHRWSEKKLICKYEHNIYELIQKVLHVIKWVLQENSLFIKLLHQIEQVITLIDVEDNNDDNVHTIMKAHSFNKSTMYLYICKECVDKVHAVKANSRYVAMFITFFFYHIYVFIYSIH